LLFGAVQPKKNYKDLFFFAFSPAPQQERTHTQQGINIAGRASKRQAPRWNKKMNIIFYFVLCFRD
jgi:hypothetical protein